MAGLDPYDPNNPEEWDAADRAAEKTKDAVHKELDKKKDK